MDEDEYFGEEFEENSIYSTKDIEELLEDDKINSIEEGFMMGYDEEVRSFHGSQLCRFCRYTIDTEDTICPACGTSIAEVSLGA
jgi:hypothetical protein